MPRKVIPLVQGEKYHIYNRGVDKRTVFEDKDDFLRFYISLDVFNKVEPTVNFNFARDKERQEKDSLVQIIAYCLLPNHFHLILEQVSENGISEFMKRINGGYTSYFNDKYERSGSLFQGTFKRIHINTAEYYSYLFAYVNENHFVHRIPRQDDICYSSSRHYQKLARSILLPDVNEQYDGVEMVALALKIATHREILKSEE